MGKRTIKKYSFFARFVWRLIRPMAMALAAETESLVDDELVMAIDELMGIDWAEDVSE